MKPVYIVGAVRTAIGAMGGGLAGIPAAELGAIVLKEAMNRAGAGHVDEVFLGAVLTAGQGQNVARQASLKAGIGEGVCATNVNMLCGSGLKAVMLGMQSILTGDNEIVAAGGTENMSAAPYTLPNARFGYWLNDGILVDTMVKDGLWCSVNDYHMGITAENLAEKYGITREEQDAFAADSQRKASEAVKNGRFADEIVSVSVKVKKDIIEFKTDEFPRADTTAEKLSKLRPAFKPTGGTVTAGNASGINDGAAAVIIASEDAVKKHGLKPMARIAAMGQAGVDPAIMGIGPADATRKALAKAGWALSDVELIEANEAFAAQSLSVAKELCFNNDIVNVNGGAIALGHPIGASGARILVTLLYEMKKRGLKKGLATLCVGGGMGVSCLVDMENL